MKTEILGYFGDDLMVVNAARVSFDKWHDNLIPEKDDRLIAYLAKHGHWAPFAHPQIQFRITVPIFVARQWFRHTVGVARNEVSRRYVDNAPVFFFPDSWRKRPDSSMKQGSSSQNIEEQNEAYELLETLIGISRHTYEKLLYLGVAPEQARMVLPQNTYTSWIETGSLYYWARFCNLRLEEHAQREIRDIAFMISKELGSLFPLSWEHLVLCHLKQEK